MNNILKKISFFLIETLYFMDEGPLVLITKKAETQVPFPKSLLHFTLISYFSTELHGFLLPPCMPARVSCRASWVSCFLLHPYYYLLCLLVKIDVQISELYGGIVLGER